MDISSAPRTEPAWTAHSDIGGGGQAAFWVDEQRRFDRMLRPFGERLLDAAAIAGGDRILDVGCGTGWTTVAAARLSAPSGRALGLDVSPMMVEAGRERAATAGLGNVAFAVADMADFVVADGSFDIVISRFAIGHVHGLGAVARRLRRALADGGRLAVMEWAPGRDNPWMAIAHPGRDRRPDDDSAHHRVLEDEATLRHTVVAAGYRSVMLELMTAPLWMAHDIDDAVGAWHASPDAAALQQAAPAEARALVDQLRARLAPFVTPRGIEVPGTAWLITARR